MSHRNETSLPVACTLSPPDFRERASKLRQTMGALVAEVQELDDGVALRLVRSEASVAAARAFVEFEQGCCGFADFALSDDGDGLWLRIRGPEGTKGFFAELIPLVLDASGD